MKKTNFILGLILLIMASFTLPAHQQTSKEQNKAGNVVTFINAYCATGNPTSDYIYVHLWNATRNYNFSVPPGAPAGYVMGSIAAECGYSVTLSSSGGPHTLQFYWFYAGYVTSATWSGADMCPTCTSCPSLRISN